jgi:hypothetical protein
MANEILLLKAKLADKKDQMKKLVLKAENYIISIREALDPYEEEFTDLEIDRALSAMQDFHILWLQAKQLKEQIKKIEKDLGVTAYG